MSQYRGAKPALTVVTFDQSGCQQNSQQGAVLMIVLLILILMATASVIALRSSMTAMDLTTTYQIKQLLLQASDAPLRQIENLLKDSQQLTGLTTEEAPFGYLANQNREQALAEYTLCYQPSQQVENSTSDTAKIITGKGQIINPKGYCNIANGQGNHFISDRKIIATQLSFIRLNAASIEGLEQGEFYNIQLITAGVHSQDNSQFKPLATAEKSHTPTPFSGTLGEDVEGSMEAHIRLYVTSVMPTFSRASLDEVDACLAKPIARLAYDNVSHVGAENQIACLERTGTPFNIQVADYVYSLKTVPLI